MTFLSAARCRDYRVEHIAEQKIKKTASKDTMQLSMIKNLIFFYRSSTSLTPVYCWLCCETSDLACYAQAKLINKNLDK